MAVYEELIRHLEAQIAVLTAELDATQVLLVMAEIALEPFADEYQPFSAGNFQRPGGNVEFAPDCEALRRAAEVLAKLKGT